MNDSQALEVRSDDLRSWTFHAGDDQVGRLLVGDYGATADLQVPGRKLSLRRYARGWHIAAFDANRTAVAAYSERWLLAGALRADGRAAAVHLPKIWGAWTVKEAGRTLLTLDVTRRGALVLRGKLHEPIDDGLLPPFAMAVVTLRTDSRMPHLRGVHTAEGRAIELDELFGDGFEMDGDFGD